MVNKNVGSLLLTTGKKLVGLITQKDILWAMIKSPTELGKVKAIEISAHKLATIKPMATTEEAFGKMKKLKFERLPVIQNKKLVGVITAKDILNFKPEFYPEIEEYAQIREEEEKLKRVKTSKSKKIISDGICEECGNRDFLYRVNGQLICESCMSAM